MRPSAALLAAAQRRLAELSKACSAALQQNSFLQAGVWATLLGAAGTTAYVGASKASALLSRYLVVSLAVRNRDEAFEWVVDWVAQNQNSNFVTSNRLQLRCAQDDLPGAYDELGSVVFEPGLGPHLFWYKGRIIYMTRAASETITSGFDRRPYTPETLELWTLGSAEVLRSFVMEARDLAVRRRQERTQVYCIEHLSWRRAAARAHRAADSVVLDDDLEKRVFADAEWFASPETQQWYEVHGVPYRRGYLFSGPPGNGKTSLAAALAARLRRPIALVSFQDSSLTDATLCGLLRDAPRGCVLLVEDVDAAFRSREIPDSPEDPRTLGVPPPQPCNLTFSGVLNAIDGVASQEGRILVLTTNHADRLDPALLRPGRIDLQVQLQPASAEQAERLLRRFHKVAPAEEPAARAFGRACAGASMAEVQGLLVRHRGDLRACLAAAEARSPSH
eukprot:TRINITY_DN25721_c0_g1_i1.p1 TRINITY_DN25721_c0_g1~~TRINITY_DN25721_c0_g1_i1.p1  ORF type:complete len:479 (+),score=145.29 TRINITY_DN25721_c0_g1_i1:91-1437(+)